MFRQFIRDCHRLPNNIGIELLCRSWHRQLSYYNFSSSFIRVHTMELSNPEFIENNEYISRFAISISLFVSVLACQVIYNWNTLTTAFFFQHLHIRTCITCSTRHEYCLKSMKQRTSPGN